MSYVWINGTHLYYQIKGKGVPILFVHPPLITSASFRYQQTQLSPFFKIITFDIRGHGKSVESVQKLTYPLIAEDIKQLLDFLGLKRVFLCGYSTGSSVVLEALASYPDRFYGGILISGMMEASDALLRMKIRAAILLSKTKATAKLLTRAVALGNADIRQSYRNICRSALHGHIRNIDQYFTYSLHYSAAEKLAHIHAPILLISGGRDKNFSRQARLMDNLLPNSETFVIPGASHCIPTKAYKEMNEKMRFWIESMKVAEEEKDPALFILGQKNMPLHIHT